MRFAVPAPVRRPLLASLALAATASVSPVGPALATAAPVADGRDVAPVVVSTGPASAAHWMPGSRRRTPVAPSLRTATSGVAAPTAPVAAVVDSAPNRAPEHSRSYTFMAEPTPGDPVRWDPCATVHWVFNPDHAPAGGLSAVQTALGRVAQATDLQFAYDGTTTAVPTGAYLQAQSATTGFRPLLVGWSTPSASTLLANQPANLVGMDQTIWARPATGATRIVSGVVALNANVTARTSGAGSWFTFAEHELGHAVGLGHTTDATQVMAPVIPASAADFGSGDLAGLARVGGTC